MLNICPGLHCTGFLSKIIPCQPRHPQEADNSSAELHKHLADKKGSGGVWTRKVKDEHFKPSNNTFPSQWWCPATLKGDSGWLLPNVAKEYCFEKKTGCKKELKLKASQLFLIQPFSLGAFAAIKNKHKDRGFFCLLGRGAHQHSVSESHGKWRSLSFKHETAQTDWSRGCS